jgi:hypothetical protein
MFTSTVLDLAQLFKTFNKAASVNPTQIDFYQTKATDVKTTAIGFCTACLAPRTIKGEVKLVNPIEFLINTYGSLTTIGLKQITEEEFYTI